MIIFGASGHSKVILDILFLNGEKVDFICDDHPKTEEIFGVQVQSNELNISEAKDAIIAIGNNEIRKNISLKYPQLNYKKAVHPKTAVSVFSEVGDGTVVMANVSVNPDAKIGKHCIINTAAVIEHDCIVEDFAHISPNASLAGNVTVGEGTHVGIGASIIQGIKIGKWCIIGAGSVIIKDVPDFSVVVGNPGRIIKNNILRNEQ